MEAIPIVAIISTNVMVIVVVYLVATARQRRVESQVQMQSKLIERFGSAPELVQFLHSPAGQQFVTGVQSATKVYTRERTISAFTRAIIMTALGGAFVFIAAIERDSGWIIPAAIVFSLGLGYVLAAWITWRLAVKFNAEDSMPPALPNGTNA